jgi:DNA-binding SARP family transcriptional activator
MISCRTLGPIEVTVEGQPTRPELLWRKPLALLIYLARSPKQRRGREHLVGLFWQDKPESAARHSLNEAIRIIRRSAGDDALLSEAGQVRLAPGVVLLDVDLLVERTAQENWREASELVNGTFLEGFSIPEASEFEDWLQSERQTWSRAAIHALVSHGQALLADGLTDQATRLAERALTLDPCSESGAVLAMRGLALAGNRSTALEFCDSFAARFKEKMGTEPGGEARALAQRLREDRVRLPTAPAQRNQDESRRTPLIGREKILNQLIAGWNLCREGDGASLTLIQGDAGMGKSRLVEELTMRAALDGGSVATTRAVEADISEPWMALRALARGGMLEFPGVAGAPPEALAGIGKYAAEWRERFPASDHGREPALAQAFCEIIRIAADERPVLLVLDDAQWVDRDSLLALTAMLRDLPRSRLMLVLAAASQPPRIELESIASGIGRDSRGTLVTLEPLTPDNLHQLARWWLPRFSTEEIERVSRRVAVDSAGLPLLAVELFRAVALGLDLHQLSAWPQPLRTLDQTLPADLPGSVTAAIRVGFRRLSNQGQQVLAAASVLAERVTAETLTKATGLDTAQVHAALDELEWHRWLVAEARGYSFVARLVREFVAEDLMTEGQRRRIRLKISEVSESN